MTDALKQLTMKTNLSAVLGALWVATTGALIDATVLARPALDVVWVDTLGTNGVWALAFSRDGKLVSAGDRAGRIRWWAVAGGGALGTVSVEGSRVEALWFRGDGSLLSWTTPPVPETGTTGTPVLSRWQLSASSRETVQVFPEGFARPTLCDAKSLIAASRYYPSSLASVWHLGEAEPLFSFVHRLDLALSPDGSDLVAALAYGSVFPYDMWVRSVPDGTVRLTRRNVTYNWPFFVAKPVYDSTGSLLLVSCYNVSEVWRMPAGEFLGAIHWERPPYNDYWRGLQRFTMDSRAIVSVHNSIMQLWQVRAIALQEEPLFQDEGAVNGARSLAVSPDGKLFACGQEDGKVVVVRLPVVVTASRQTDAELALEWFGASGPYQLQRAADLGPGDWQDEGDPTTATTVTVPLSGQAAFYRVRSLP